MKPRRYDSRTELIKSLPDFNQAFKDLTAPTRGNHYVASAALVRGYLEIIRSHNSDSFPPEPATTSERAQRRLYASDYRRHVVDSNPELLPDTKVAALHFCCMQDPFSSARIVHFLAESVSLPSELGGDLRKWHAQSQFGLLTYTAGPVATHVMSGKIGHFVCTPLFSLAAFGEEVARLRIFGSPGMKVPALQFPYLFKLAIDSLSKGPKMRKVDPNSVDQLRVISHSESDCWIQLDINDFRTFEVAMTLCKTTWQVEASAKQWS
jgi:hypothetical protein